MQSPNRGIQTRSRLEGALNKHFDVGFCDRIAAEQFSKHENNDCQYVWYCGHCNIYVLETSGVASKRGNESSALPTHSFLLLASYGFVNRF